MKSSYSVSSIVENEQSVCRLGEDFQATYPIKDLYLKLKKIRLINRKNANLVKKWAVWIGVSPVKIHGGKEAHKKKACILRS